MAPMQQEESRNHSIIKDLLNPNRQDSEFQYKDCQYPIEEKELELTRLQRCHWREHWAVGGCRSDLPTFCSLDMMPALILAWRTLKS